MAALEDFLGKLIEETRYNRVILTAMWQLQQRKEANKTPDGWAGTMANVYDANFQQILSHNQQRASVSINNLGPATVALSNRYLDANEAAALNTVLANGLTVQMLELPSGSSVTIGTRGPIYAYSLGYVSTGGTAAKLQIVETIYNVPLSTIQNPTVALGHSAMLEKGLPIEGNSVHDQGPLV